MAVSHAKSDTIADFTGTITGFNSQGSTTTIAATDLVRPSDWNSAHNQFYTLTGNTTGNSTASGTNVLIAGSGAILVGGSTGTVIVSSPAMSMWFPVGTYGRDQFIATQEPGNGSIRVWPVAAPGAIVVSKFLASVSLSISSSSNSSHGGTLSIGVGIYTRNVSTLSLVSSALGTYAWTNTSNNSTASLAGLREVSGAFGGQVTLTGGDYWLAFWSRTSTVNANWYTASNIHMITTQTNSTHSGNFMSAAGAASFQPGVPGVGTYSATSSVLPASMAFSHITGTARWGMRPNLVMRNFDP